MTARLPCTAAPPVQTVIDELGRTEDLVFSPSNRRFAVAGFGANRIAVFDIELTRTRGGSAVFLPRVVELQASFFKYPHGVCFLDEQTLAVANRNGQVHIVDAPPTGTPRDRQEVTDRMKLLGGAERLVHTPGSVAAIELGDGSFEVAVCNNAAHHVTRHIVRRRGREIELGDEGVLVEAGLDIPDGICYSPDGRWMAVSSHNTHNVFVYERTPALNRHAEPDAVLRNVLCPHGVRFTADGRFILVADASARCVNVYRGDGTGWKGTLDPWSLFPVMSTAVFRRGRLNPQEGGPKGIDVDREMSVLAVTCECQTLAFFDLASVLGQRRAPQNRHRRYVQWRLEHALHRRRPALYGWLQRPREAAPSAFDA
jgi:DNA-binding beta-propeller fold protein YncE